MVISRLRRADWPGAVVFPLAVVLMEACWVAPWLAWIGGWPVFEGASRPVLGFGSIAATLAISLLLGRLVQWRGWPLRLSQAVTIGGGFLVVLVALAVEYRAGHFFLGGGWFEYFGRLLAETLSRPGTAAPAVLALLYLWWRGLVLAQATASYRNAYRPFLLGLAALIVLLVFWRAGAETGPGAGAGFYVMGFFFFGLLAIALGHLYLVRRSMPREDAALTPARRWLPVMLGVVGGLVALGFAAASVLSPEFFDVILRGARAVFDFLGTVINYVLVPFGYVFEAIFWVLRVIVGWLRTEPLEPVESGEQGFPEFTPRTLVDLPEAVAIIIQWLVIALAAAAVVYVLARAVARFRGRGQPEEIEEVHESLFSWEGLGDDLAAMLKALGDRFRRKPRSPRAAWRDDDSRLDVREIYRRLMYEAALSGLPRRLPETPAEYARRLGGALPESAAPVSGLTELYASVRYGERRLPAEQVDGANGLWRALREALRSRRETAA